MSDQTREDALEMEVFRTGDYGERGEWNEEALEALARDYDPRVHEAPLTLDHAQSGPALGWVRALRRAGDRLVARVGLIPERVRGFLRMGAYTKRSVEIVRSHPATGRPYLRAVSLLGAASPAVEGLAPVAFAAGEAPGDAERIEFRTDVTDAANAGDAPAAAEDAGRADAGTPGEADILRGELEALRARAAERDAAHFVERMRSRGVALFDADEAMIRRVAGGAWAGAGSCAPAPGELLDWLAGLLEQRAPVMPEGEAAAEGAPPACGADAVGFSERCDPVSAELHRRALARLGADPSLTYAAALMAVAGTQPPRR